MTFQANQENHPISEYLEKIAHNLGGPLPVGLIDTDRLILKLTEALVDVENLTSARLYLLAFSSWRNAVALAQAGAVSQVPICLRHCVETCLYLYLFARDPVWETVWLDRETNEGAKKKLRSSKNGPLKAAKELLRKEKSHLFEFTRDSIEIFIDFGAHPNIFQLVNVTEIVTDEIEKMDIFKVSFLANDANRKRALISCIGIGFMLIDFYQLLWSEVFEKQEAIKDRNEAYNQSNLFIRSVYNEQNI